MAIGFKNKLARLRPFFHLLPICILGLIPFTGADIAQMRLHYTIRGQLSPGPEVSKRLHVITLPPNANKPKEQLAPLALIAPNVHCINLSRQLSTFAQCQTVDLNQKPDEVSFVRLIHSTFFNQTHRDERDNETLFYYGRLEVFNPTPLSRLSKSEAENLSENSLVVLVDEGQKNSERWTSPFGFLSTQELALNAIVNHLQGDSYQLQSRYAVFLLMLFCIFVVGSLTYSYPLTLAIALTATLYGFLLVTSMVLFERYGYQISLFAPTLGIFLSYLVSISDQLNQKRRLEYTIDRQQEAHVELDTMRQNFLSLVSHDLKTPIAKIQALMEKLLGEELGALAPKQKQTLESALSANGHLQKTISTLFLLNRIESNQIKIHLTPNDLREVLDHSIASLQSQAKDANINITSELEPMFLSNFDRDLIREVADNLISNAIKYSPGGSTIVIRCGDDDNALELAPPQPAIWFEVQDQGPGIPLEDRSRVLQKFQRGAKEATSKGQSVKGTGLGLYLSKYFVEEHQGRLVVISKTTDEGLRTQAKPYFSADHSGTVIRVVIPIESS